MSSTTVSIPTWFALLAVSTVYLGQYVDGVDIALDFQVVGSPSFEPWEEFAFSCHGYKTGSDVTIQFVKPVVSLGFPLDPEAIFYGNYILSNNDVLLDPLIGTGRYSISSEGNNTFVLTVAEARPEDSGSWGCRMIDANTGESIRNSTFKEVFIEDPHLEVALATGYDYTQTENETLLEDGSTVSLLEYQKIDIYCRVFLNNSATQFDTSVTIGSGDQARDITGDYFIKVSSYSTLNDGGLIWGNWTTRYYQYSLHANHDDDGKVFACTSYADPANVVSASVILDITAVGSHPEVHMWLLLLAAMGTLPSMIS